MAIDEVVAARYAGALLALAEEAGQVEPWRAALSDAVTTITAPDVAAAVLNPIVDTHRRARLAEELLGGAPAQVRNLVRLLVEHGRGSSLATVLAEYDRAADRAAGVVRAEVIAAVPVDAALRTRIGSTLAERLGEDVRTSFSIDPAVIGGLVIRIGDRVIDGSVRTRLERLRAVLA